MRTHRLRANHSVARQDRPMHGKHFAPLSPCEAPSDWSGSDTTQQYCSRGRCTKPLEPNRERRIRRPCYTGGFGATKHLKTSLKLNLKVLTATVSDAAVHIQYLSAVGISTQNWFAIGVTCYHSVFSTKRSLATACYHVESCNSIHCRIWCRRHFPAVAALELHLGSRSSACACRKCASTQAF